MCMYVLVRIAYGQFYIFWCDIFRSIHFGRGTCSHLMVIATCDQIQCWDLASCAISWYSEIENITFVVQDQFSENMALFTDDKEGNYCFWNVD